MGSEFNPVLCMDSDDPVKGTVWIAHLKNNTPIEISDDAYNWLVDVLGGYKIPVYPTKTSCLAANEGGNATRFYIHPIKGNIVCATRSEVKFLESVLKTELTTFKTYEDAEAYTTSTMNCCHNAAVFLNDILSLQNDMKVVDNEQMIPVKDIATIQHISQLSFKLKEISKGSQSTLVSKLFW